MLRYTKNGPFRAPVCTSAQGTSRAALQWLLCSNTHLKTKSGKAAFYGFHGEMKAAGRHATRSRLQPSVRPCVLLLLQPLVHTFYALCCKSSDENVNAACC